MKPANLIVIMFDEHAPRLMAATGDIRGQGHILQDNGGRETDRLVGAARTTPPPE